MPELPEVETLRRDLSRAVIGRRIIAVELLRPRLLRGTDGYTFDDMIGMVVQEIRRRAKYLIVELSNGLSLVIHLGLAGQIVLERPSGERIAGGHPVPSFDQPLPHSLTSLILRLDDGSVLYLTDIRQFARLWLVPTGAVEMIVPETRLGIEPVAPEFTPSELASRLRRHPRGRLKPLLLDQSLLAGLGNIYVDEALWGAGLHPLRTVESLDDADVGRLYEAIKEVLDLALTYGVARIINGRAIPGARLPRVHGRAGQPCPRCGHPIEKLRVGGRGTYICPVCQPLVE